MAIKARFKSNKDGEFHVGIPARNLTDEDWAVLSKDDQNLVKASPLYNVVDEKDSAPEDRERHARRIPETPNDAPMPEANQPKEAQ